MKYKDKDKKIAVLYHKSDLDGLASGIIAERYINARADSPCLTFGCDYGNIHPDFKPEDYDLIYVLDFSDVDMFNKHHSKIIWIDHHQNMRDFKHLVFAGGYLLENVAACRLAFQYFTNTEYSFLTEQNYRLRQVGEPLFIALAGEHDIWDQKSPNATPFSFGTKLDWDKIKHAIFNATFTYYAESYVKGQELNDPNLPEVIKESIKVGSGVLDYLNQTTRRLSGGIKTRLFGHETLMLNCDTRSSLVSNGNEDVTLVWNISDDMSRVKVSLYSKDFNVYEIAKRFGGGGHKKAAGFMANLETIKAIAAGGLSAPPAFADMEGEKP